MKKVNYKGVELEAYDSSTVTSYNKFGECKIEFNVVYRLDRLTFLSLEEVDKYLRKQRVIEEYKGVKIYRAMPMSKNSAVYGSKCSTVAYDTINEVKASIDMCNYLHVQTDNLKKTLSPCKNDNSKLKTKNENDFPNCTSDNRLAIRMLNSVSEIISEIERDNEDMIELNLNELKTRVSQFEKVFYNNKQKGMYR